MIRLRKISLPRKIHLGTDIRWNTQESNIIPFVLLGPLIIHSCMSLATLEFATLAYAVFAMVLAGISFMLLLCMRKREISQYGVLSFICMMTLIMFSLINYENSDVKNGFYLALEIWFFQMLCFYYRNRIHIVVICAAIWLSFCVYANFAHIMLHPNLWIADKEGLKAGYLLGNNYNGMGFRMILAIVISTICMRYSWKWIFNVVPVIVFSLIPLVLTNSMTSFSGIVIFAIACCIPIIRIKKIIANCILGAVIFFQIFIVFVGKGVEHNDLIVYIIEDVLHKDITFTDRIFLWDMAVDKIMESPIWGWGFVDDAWYESNVKIQWGAGPHNLMLAILLHGGIIFFGLFVSILITSIKKVIKYNEHYASVIQLSIAILMMMHLMEAASYFFIFFLLTIAYYYPYTREVSTSEMDNIEMIGK